MAEKLDLMRLPEGLQRFAAELIDILTALDPINVDRHLELARAAPEGIGDSEHFEIHRPFLCLPMESLVSTLCMS